MNRGPLRRLVGCVGLVALVPIAWQLFAGGLGPVGAAGRALAVLAAVVVVGRLTTRYLDAIADAVVRDAVTGVERTHARPRPPQVVDQGEGH